MKRPLFVIGLVFTVTTWAAFHLDGMAVLAVSGAFAVTAVLPVVLRRDDLRNLSIVCVSAAIACGSYTLYAFRVPAPLAEMDGETVPVEGVIVEYTPYTNSGSYTIIARFPQHPSLPQNQRIQIRAWSRLEYGPGDSISCTLELHTPASAGREAYYTSKGIVALGYPKGEVVDGPPDLYRGWQFWVTLRRYMERNLGETLTEDSAQIVGAMSLGMRDSVELQLYGQVQRAGTVHLLVVSGLHLSVVTALALRLLTVLRVPRIPRYLLAMVAAGGFALMVGLSASIVRALVMTAFFLAGNLLSRQRDSRNALGFALAVICIFWPHWTQGLGFWLSAGSTLGIILFAGNVQQVLFDFFRLGHSRLHKLARPFLAAAGVSVSAYVFTLPVLVFSGGGFSLISPIANLLIAPFVLPTIIGGMLCAFFGTNSLLMAVVAPVTDFCASMIAQISRTMASLPFAFYSLDEGYHIIILFLAVALAGAVVYWRGGKQLIVYALTLCILCCGVGELTLSAANEGRVELVTLSDCGPALLLRDRQAVVLGVPSRYDVGVLLNYLSYRDVDRISAVIAADQGDQVDSGLLRLAENYPVDCVVGPDDAYVLDLLEAALPETRVLSGGYAQILVLDGAVVALLPGESGIQIRTGSHLVLKFSGEYDIMKYPADAILLDSDGFLPLPQGTVPLAEPMGRRLFGEVRLSLSTKN